MQTREPRTTIIGNSTSTLSFAISLIAYYFKCKSLFLRKRQILPTFMSSFVVRVGHAGIEVKHGFNPELLRKIVRVLAIKPFVNGRKNWLFDALWIKRNTSTAVFKSVVLVYAFYCCNRYGRFILVPILPLSLVMPFVFELWLLCCVRG